jgi:hypothetical protein
MLPEYPGVYMLKTRRMQYIWISQAWNNGIWESIWVKMGQHLPNLGWAIPTVLVVWGCLTKVEAQ